MRVVFVENDHRFIFGLPLGFRDAGHSILVTGALTDSKLDDVFSSFKPQLVIVVGWSKLHTPSNLEAIHEFAKSYGVPVIYWATEDPTFTTFFSIPLVKLLCPSWVFTVSASSIPLYAAFGYVASFLPFAYQPTIFHPNSKGDFTPTLVGLVANAYPNVLEYDATHFRKNSIKLLLSPLLDQNIQVDIWGNDWDKMSSILGKTLPSSWLHGGIHYLKTNAIYNSCDIILGLQNYCEGVIAMRFYEILGSGGFLMTSNNKELEYFFCPEKDFITVNSYEEMLEKYLFYKKNESAREKVRANGFKSISIHTYKSRALEIINTLQKENII
ncbi:MAG: peptigoglycan-binding protein LysM [Firmicutes bacterium HGW-Firmicutes-7]|nr:MAG: peptigoglycan-binding protein LysM [Firmicutes bacterium HGW-Firmicutes-7]